MTTLNFAYFILYLNVTFMNRLLITGHTVTRNHLVCGIESVVQTHVTEMPARLCPLVYKNCI
jgi:hypothetical protein